MTTYHRMRTPEGAGVTIRQAGREIRLSVGSSQRMRCNTTEAYALLATLADVLGADLRNVPDWATETPIEVSDQ